MGVEVAEEVPGRVDEGVHGVGLATRRAPALRALRVDPVGDRSQRALPLGRVVLDLGQLDRELLVGDRDHAVALAVDDRDRAAPVALAREQPVAEAVVDRRAALALGAQPLDDLGVGLAVVLAVERAAGDQRPVADVGLRLDVLAAGDDLADLDPEPARELVVAGVVGGDRHQGTGPVLHQHVVGDEHRDLLAVDRVGNRAAERNAGLLAPLVAALLDRLARGGVDVGADLVLAAGPGSEPLDVGVLGREHEEGGAEEGVGPGGEDGEVDPELLAA